MPWQSLYPLLHAYDASAWAEQLPRQIASAMNTEAHGDLAGWQAAIAALPEVEPQIKQIQDCVQIGAATDLSALQHQQLIQQLKKLHPWRKGPYQLFDHNIDTEWRSDWKWQRLQAHISPLSRRLVLDVGCGNGYHCWRMLGAGAKLVIGIDPTLLSVMQFLAIKKLYGPAAAYVLPLGIEDMPPDLRLFDTVFSMGVLYHRRSPIDHLLELKACLRPGGELVLETLVIADSGMQVLMPEQRYAKMRNVWFLPSCDMLLLWLRRCGFVDAKLINIGKTSCAEQRSTEWMRFHSLADFLDADDHNLTCEGLPAPVRAIFTATAP